ncbi:MAG: hypothetical protein H7X86_10795 [Gorillibacterium sp.]|nr:hypothetical protein [Gorillibacterium sp.]
MKGLAYGEVEFTNPGIAVFYNYEANQFLLKNLADGERTFQIDLSALYPGTTKWMVSIADQEEY